MDILFDFQEYTERLLQLDNLYLEILAVSGHSAEQLLELFKAGYTLEPQKDGG